jgi:hypothetical protein
VTKCSEYKRFAYFETSRNSTAKPGAPSRSSFSSISIWRTHQVANEVTMLQVDRFLAACRTPVFSFVWLCHESNHLEPHMLPAKMSVPQSFSNVNLALVWYIWYVEASLRRFGYPLRRPSAVDQCSQGSKLIHQQTCLSLVHQWNHPPRSLSPRYFVLTGVC